MMTIRRSQNIAALLLLHLLSGSGGDQPDDGEAGDGVGGGAAGRLLVSAGCGNGGAAGLAERFSILSLNKFHKIVNYFSFKVLKKKIWANFQRIIENFSQKIVKKLLNMVLGSGIRDPEKTYSGFPIF